MFLDLAPVRSWLSLSSLLAIALVPAAPGCSSAGGDATTLGSGGSGGPGGTGGSGGSGVGDCAQAASMLDVSKAPGAGPGYPAPTLSAYCTADTFAVDGNVIPHYTFVQTTPNPLVSEDYHFEIPRYPEPAAATAPVPLLGTAGFAVNGLPFFGPNEGGQPADTAYGDPVYNGLMDPCLGHTAFVYHYHSMEEKCLVESGLVAQPWTNADPPAGEPSPILGWALDGFPIYGPRECDAEPCTQIVTMQSGYAQTGDPKSNAWDAYTWQDHPGDATYLDECNGHYGPKGDYHYHTTAGFPYIVACYRGMPELNQSGSVPDIGGGGTGGGGTGGPKMCTSSAECGGACPPGSIGCTCAQGPMGMICVPSCNTNADCPPGPMGTLTCQNGACLP